MGKVYEFTRNLNGEPRLEIVMLLNPNGCDFDDVLHRVGLELCMSRMGKKGNEDVSELTFEQLMDSITPEMLKPYGVTMYRLRDCAKQMDGAAPVVSRCEMELYRNLCDEHAQQFRELREYAERIARRLEGQRTHGHPAISTWDPSIIPAKAIVWAYLFITGNEDFATFFTRKLQEAKPHASTRATHAVGESQVYDDPAEQQAERMFQ